jgi:1-deoxy-D-xylulose-5-phosphate reductoisomerase
MVVLPQVDLVVMALSGLAGLKPTLQAIQAGKVIALANKESLVMAGEIIKEQAERSGASILPVDSEHSAIWQCLKGEQSDIARVILTASGGPFRNYTREMLDKVTPQQALKHPSWQMGPKVTIDSATLLNKGLEVIEAHYLFDISYDQIDVLIHPSSLVHSLVEFVDGSVKAQLGVPDMRTPIQHALSYPERWFNQSLPRIDWANINNLSFEKPDLDAFPCLGLAIEAGRRGATYPAVLCGAGQACVDMFLASKIRFTRIDEIIKRLLTNTSRLKTQI